MPFYSICHRKLWQRFSFRCVTPLPFDTYIATPYIQQAAYLFSSNHSIYKSSSHSTLTKTSLIISTLYHLSILNILQYFNYFQIFPSEMSASDYFYYFCYWVWIIEFQTEHIQSISIFRVYEILQKWSWITTPLLRR